MVDKIGVMQRNKMWNTLRKRKTFSVKNLSSRKEFIQRMRRTYGFKKGQHLKGKSGTFIKNLSKSGFWRESKKDGLYISSRKRDWSQGEISLLKGLKKQGFKGKGLTRAFNEKVTNTRSYKSVIAKARKV